MSSAILVLLGIMALSALGGWWLSARQDQEKAVTVMLFVGYFWALAFAQLLLVAASYFGWQHYTQ